MDIFRENKCRLCTKVFCCVKCRKKHEEKTHTVNPDCDICFYGRAILRNASENLLLHIKTKHWPLHCVNCNRIFGSVEELVTHNKCPVNTKLTVDNLSNMIPITPNLLIENYTYDSNYDSPPFMFTLGKNANVNITIPNKNNVMQLTTSTPMQDDEDKHFLENISQAITPVDGISKNNEKSDSKINLDVPKESMKRRVTFNETTISELSESYNNSKTDTKTSLKEKDFEENEIQGSFDKNDEYQYQSNLSNTKWDTAISDTPKYPEREQISLSKINENKENENWENSYSSIRNSIKLESSEEKHYPNTRSNDNEVDVSSTIWSFMTNLVKNVMSGLPSKSTQSRKEKIRKQIKLEGTTSRKRLRSDSDILEDLRCFKKMKLTDIKCRKPINCTIPYKAYLQKIVRTCEKATQTDFL